MTNILVTEEIIHLMTLVIPKGMKNATSFPTSLGAESLIRNEKVFPRDTKQKPLENILKSE